MLHGIIQIIQLIQLQRHISMVIHSIMLIKPVLVRHIICQQRENVKLLVQLMDIIKMLHRNHVFLVIIVVKLAVQVIVQLLV